MLSPIRGSLRSGVLPSLSPLLTRNHQPDILNPEPGHSHAKKPKVRGPTHCPLGLTPLQAFGFGSFGRRLSRSGVPNDL